MKFVQKGIGLIVATCISLLGLPSALAVNGLSNDERALLNSAGLPDEIIQVMPENDISKFIEIYTKTPEKVSVQTTTTHFDEVGMLREYVNSTYDEKIDAGYTPEDILQNEQMLNALRESSDSSLVDDVGVPADEILYFRQALTPNSCEVIPYGDGDVTPSEMTLSLVLFDNSNSSGPDYDVSVYFEWDQVYNLGIFDDKIAVAWGGDLVQDSFLSRVNYYAYDRIWEEFDHKYEAGYTESVVNGGGYYYFPQRSKLMKAKEGAFGFSLSQRGYEDKKTKIIVQYCHQVLSLSGANITITANGPTVGISVSNGYDTSPQESDTIVY